MMSGLACGRMGSGGECDGEKSREIWRDCRYAQSHLLLEEWPPVHVCMHVLMCLYVFICGCEVICDVVFDDVYGCACTISPQQRIV